MALMMMILLLLFVTLSWIPQLHNAFNSILMPIVRTYNIDPVHFGIIANSNDIPTHATSWS